MDLRGFVPGPLDETSYLDSVVWVIAGGESGPNARPCHPDWIRSLVEQCKVAGVPFFFKQWGEWLLSNGEEGPEIPFNWANHQERYLFLQHDGSHGTGYDGGRGEFMAKVGKAAAGRLLDGRTWDEFPEVAKP